MKKILALIISSFIFGFLASRFELGTLLFAILLGTTLLLVYFKKTKTHEVAPLKSDIHPRTRFWDNVYFYLLSLDSVPNQNELRVWGLNIAEDFDLESLAQLSDQVALKGGSHLKMLVTDPDIEILEKYTKSSCAQKIQFAKLDPSETTWPFKNKFDIIFIGKIKQIDIAKKSFHRRLEACMHPHSVLIIDPRYQDQFLKNSWERASTQVLVRTNTAPLSHRPIFDLNNDIRSNFL
ncbi:MAG: hypothetical protein AABY64_00500 [Bdellovibrionota bacterium]